MIFLKKDNEYYDGNIFLQGIIRGAVIGVVTLAVSVAVFSLVVTLLDLPRSFCPFFSLAAISLCSFFSALCCSKFCSEGGLKCGSIMGGIFFIVFALVTIILGSSQILIDLFIRLVCCMLPSLAGGVIGVNIESKRKFKI